MNRTDQPPFRAQSALEVRKRQSAGSPTPYSGNVKVAVRVRPTLPRESSLPILTSVDEQTNSVSVRPAEAVSASVAGANTSSPKLLQTAPKKQAKSKTEPKTFFYDRCLSSIDPELPNFADQEDVYEAVGRGFLDHTMQGYNTTIFAYGQTGSGKSYTMMGPGSNRGIIPKTCDDLFERIAGLSSANFSCTVWLSYLEVYNEQVRDLLDSTAVGLSSSSSSSSSSTIGLSSSRSGTSTPVSSTASSAPRKTRKRTNLRVRESQIEGPYVEGLSQYVVSTAEQAVRYLELGNKQRSTASTQMNDASSRSHAVLTLTVKQTIFDTRTDASEERLSHIRLVDLAGSERANTSGNSGDRLREGSNINKSLSTLGRVISALTSKKPVVPYRDSVLTWLLKESLGGNSKTAMIACISPTDYEETLSTLRYADQARQIRNKPKINQDIVSAAARDKLVEDMQNQINALQLSLHHQEQDENGRKELLKLTRAIQYYQDRAISEESKRRAIQAENAAVMRHNKLLSEHLREISSRDTSGGQFSSEHAAIAADYAKLKSRLSSSREKWTTIVSAMA